MKKLISVSVLMPILLLIVMIITGCLNKNTSVKKADNQLDLKAINDSVAKLNSGPAYLLRKAKYELGATDIYAAKTDIENLLKQYPNSYQVPEAKELLNTIDRKINNVTEEKKQNVPQSEKTSYPMVSADSYSIGSKERAFAEFLISWQNKNWSRMVKFTQKTWSSGESNPAETLEAWYGFKNLLGAKITKKTAESNVSVDITATIYYAFGSEIKTKLITARVIREVAPYKPSPKGEWGVNPISTIAEE